MAETRQLANGLMLMQCLVWISVLKIMKMLSDNNFLDFGVTNQSGKMESHNKVTMLRFLTNGI